MDRHQLFKIAVIWFLLLQTFPPFNLLFPISEALKLAIFLGVSMVLFPNLIKKGSFVMLLIFTAETFFYFLMGNAYYETFNTVIIPFLTMGSALIITEYALEYDNNYKFTRLVLLVSVIATIIISIISIPILNTRPELIRLAYAQATRDDVDVTSVSSFIVPYNTINGICFLIAPLVFLCRKAIGKNKFFFIFWLFALLLFYYIVMKSNVATPFVICSGMIVLGLLFGYERFNNNNIPKIVIIGIIGLLLMTPTVLVPILRFIQNNIEYGSLSVRLGEIEETLIYGESDGDLGSRNELYNRSWNLFLESPIVGTSTPERISHHTYFIDHLACHGIFFILPLVFLFAVHFKSVYKKLYHTKVTYTFGFAALIFLLFYKNGLVGLFGFCLLPFLCRYIDYSLDNSLNKPIKSKRRK